MNWRANQLRVVNSRTADWDGGYTVETADGLILGGPYATKDFAKGVKRALVAGEPVPQESCAGA